MRERAAAGGQRAFFLVTGGVVLEKQITRTALLVTAAALLFFGLAAGWLFSGWQLSSTRAELSGMLEVLEASGGAEAASGLAGGFSQESRGLRLAVLDGQGQLLLDTGGDARNYTESEELQEALASGWGEAIHYSGLNAFLTVAKRMADGSVACASAPLYSLGGIVGALVAAFALAAVLTAITASHIARRALAPVEKADMALKDIAEGRVYAVDWNSVPEEYVSLFRSVERLEGYVHSIVEERDKVTLILDCMDEGVMLLDERGSILASNRAARKLFHVPEGAENASILTFIHSRRLRSAIREMKWKKGAMVLDMDNTVVKDRSLRFFISSVKGKQYEGEQVGASVLITDVTELKRAEGIRSEFTANVSHELKTPLTSIKGFTDMLASGIVVSPEDQKRFLTMISVEVDRLIDLINDILKVSELESVAIDQCEETSEPLAAANEVAAFLAPVAQKAQVAVQVKGEAFETAIPYARLKELLLNLMENGIKYNEPGGRVDVALEQEGGFARITVSDTGIGIPEECQARVFERFYRVDKGRARKNGGTGLGLAIVKHIVVLYGGRMALQSKLGEGSSFTIWLPLAEKKEQET